ncbi:tetratricopeptide repeat-containing sensor histidine kinase [Aquimarina sp. 2201CG14-23]|uniref:tetratricopeptide repeat-containing sensor histidine kinase n=1 Tax=Aquimarina mycalae TaxID=3040073 RepID=UPI00247814BC|nr:tetratricopeptide repeat-containing sensor histidine kinase [Aquimarina sp. 2201CG14-23]MDH7447751.1 hypothetical protein [Aquimarina sp. 2201CG14-23]
MRFLKLKALLICFSFVFASCEQKTETSKKNIPKLNLIDSYIENSKDPSKTIEERKEYLKNAYTRYITLNDNIYKRKKIGEISVSYYHLNDYKTSKKMDKEMLNLSISINDSLGIAEAYSRLGIYYRSKQLLDSTYYYFYKADKLYISFNQGSTYSPLDYVYDHGKVLVDLAKLSRKAKDYSESEALTIKAIEKFKLSENYKYLPLCYTNLGIISKYLERYENAVMYHQKAIKFAKNTTKENQYASLGNNNIGTIYKAQKKYNKAIEHYNKALTYKDFLRNNQNHYARILGNLAYVNFLANKTKNLPNDLLHPLKIKERIGDKSGMSTSYLHLAEYYKSIQNDSLSTNFAQKAKLAALAVNNNGLLLQSYEILAQISKPYEGRTYAMKYIKLNDSLVKNDQFFRDKFARIRYESENLEKENEQKNKEILEVQNQNTIYFLGIILLVTFLGFIIYFSRQRTRYLSQQNKIVQFQTAYETETRISKRLHDELGNDIFQVMMQYQHDPHDPQIVPKLNTAYTKARDISRENSEFETDESFPEELSDMLQNYTQNQVQLILRGFDKINWDVLDKNIKITIYRVLQELMTNMQKHSKANLVAIVFKKETNTLTIKYSDNGVGVAEEHKKSKNGLRNTEKRIQAINGTLTFDSEKDKGFKAEIVIPA